jgi:vacuolar-type H+-ATPase subunit H
MPTKEISSSVATIEAEAEKVLEDANRRASEILLKAREEANKILSSELPMGEVKKECDEITAKASTEADDKIAGSVKKASEIGTNADKKVKDIVTRVVNIIKGTSSE